jgi:hypothetical protein
MIGKIFLSTLLLVLFNLLRKTIKNQKPKARSRLWDFDKEKIIEGEIVHKRNRHR